MRHVFLLMMLGFLLFSGAGGCGDDDECKIDLDCPGDFVCIEGKCEVGAGEKVQPPVP